MPGPGIELIGEEEIAEVMQVLTNRSLSRYGREDDPGFGAKVRTVEQEIAALAGVRYGVPVLDPIAALIVAGFIGHAGLQIALTTTRILSDRIVISEDDLQREVMSVPGVLGCHRIRTRGLSDHVFLDLHVWLPADMPLVSAHALSHVVKDRVMSRYPQIADAVIHIEPPPDSRLA